MKRMRLALAFTTMAALLLALVLATAAKAEMQGYSAQYAIDGDAVHVELAFAFNGTVPYFEWLLPKDAVSIETSPSYFEIAELKDSRKIAFRNGLLKKVSISYATGSLLQSSGSTVFFVSDVADVDAPKKSVTVALPEKATLKYELESKRSIVPLTGDVSTDGKRIIVRWHEGDFGSGPSMLVIFSPDKDSGMSFAAVAAVMAFGMLSFFGFYVYGRKAKAAKTAFAKSASKNELATGMTTNLLEDEKKIVELLIGSDGGELWQKQLEIKSGITKVRLSRKLRSLEQKGLIEKIPFGNANKIRLKEPQQP